MTAQPPNGYPESSIPRRFAFRHVLVLLALLCCTLVACNEPDYTKPSPGSGPNAFVVPESQVLINTPLPSPLPCGQPYKFTALVKEKVKTCEGYDYKSLYDLAKTLVDKQIQSRSPSCPEGCSPYKKINTALRWKCSQDFTSTLFASLDLQVSLICPPPGAELPKGYNPSDEELKKNEFNFDPNNDLIKNVEAMEGTVITQTRQSSRNCPSKQLYQVYYSESLSDFAAQISASDCSSLKNQPVYQPFVKKGETQAKEYYDTIVCDVGCDKSPFEVFSQTWGCEKSTKSVWVRTYFYVECKKKQ